ncbi:hypothetical protein ACOSQ3_025606 [Xanthoceras sorbifolium]
MVSIFSFCRALNCTRLSLVANEKLYIIKREANLNPKWDLVSALGHFPVRATGAESEQMDFYRLRNDVFGTCSRNMAIWEIHVGIGLLKLCSVNMENASLLWALDAANRGALVRPFDCFRRWMALPSNV